MGAIAPIIAALPHVGTSPHAWREIPISRDMSAGAQRTAARLNGLGSLYYFAKYILGYTRFSPSLHRYMCQEMERDTIRLGMEIPRDHFKTSVAVASAMWWALPFTAEDEDLMRQLGYDDPWIAWMRRAHFTSTRTLIASETIGNARKMGVRIDGQYKSNSTFRYLYPEILPKTTDRWNQDSMTHNRLDGEYHGEGTYDFIGVKGALQSRHYQRQLIDDPVGEKALNSDIVMEGTIDWIRKLPGAMDSDPLRPAALADQCFIGNRWSHRDVGTWLRKNTSGMTFATHSAEGGCCTLHPTPRTPIFPEEFTMEKLAEIRQIEGPYNYAAQFLNQPTSPEAVRFERDWLRHYQPIVYEAPTAANSIAKDITFANQQQHGFNSHYDETRAEIAGAIPSRLRMAMRHEVRSGETVPDIRAGELDRVLLMDPNHSGENGRSRNAILCLGFYNRPNAPRRIYILESWAKACDHPEWIEAAIGNKPQQRGMALRWRVHAIYFESEVAGQQGWKYYIKERIERIRRESPNEAMFSVRPLKTDRSAGGKDKRIIGMESFYETGVVWCPRQGSGINVFLEEYDEYPNGSTNDVLDLMGYAPQAFIPGVGRSGTRDFMREEVERRKRLVQTLGPAGY